MDIKAVLLSETMSFQLNDCMDCKHIKTEKRYDNFGNGYRVNVCGITNVYLVWDDELKIHNEANSCEDYKHYSDKEEEK